MRKSSLQLFGSPFEYLNLTTCKNIELRRITPYKMGEYRTRNQCILILQPTYQHRHFFFGETQTMHARIKFDMYREVCNAFFLRRFYQRIEQVEVINFRLELVIKHCLECSQFRIHNHNRRSNTRFTQFRSFIGHGHGQVIHLVFLQCFGYLIRTGSIGRSLNHTYHFCCRLKHRAIMIQIGHHSPQIYLQYRFVYFQLQPVRNKIKIECTGTFNQYHLIMQILKHIRLHQLFRSMEEVLLYLKTGSTGKYLRSHTYYFVNATTLYQLGYLTIKSRGTLSGL